MANSQKGNQERAYYSSHSGHLPHTDPWCLYTAHSGLWPGWPVLKSHCSFRSHRTGQSPRNPPSISQGCQNCLLLVWSLSTVSVTLRIPMSLLIQTPSGAPQHLPSNMPTHSPSSLSHQVLCCPPPCLPLLPVPGLPYINLPLSFCPWRRAWQPTLLFLPGESPWTEEPGRLPSMGWQRVGYA